jgi:8-oxo-dGTP pyrophosphatase MutT (NUDIX family)
MKWKISSSKYLVKDKWLKLRADSCTMPDGNIIEPYYVFEYPAWVNILGITSDNNVILVKQYRHGIQEVVLELPCGCVEDNGESELEAAKRELLEETGYTSQNFFQTSIIYPNPANHNNKTYCFLATDLEKVSDISLDEGEDIETVLMPLDDFVKMFENNKFQQALHISCIYYGLQYLKKSN